jgi:hypothetical protein
MFKEGDTLIKQLLSQDGLITQPFGSLVIDEETNTIYNCQGSSLTPMGSYPTMELAKNELYNVAYSKSEEYKFT